MRKIHSNKWIVKSIVCLLVFIGVSALGTGITAHAQTSGGFSIKAVIPENQIDMKQTYFDLRMKPGDEQDLQVVITNSRDEELTAEVRLNAASTGRNGLIVYTAPDIRDESMEVSIADIATLTEQTVTVPANSSRTVTIRLKMPEDAFDGVILGGIAVTGNDIEEEQAVQGVSLKNTITYVIALRLTETDEKPDADFTLVSIAPELINHRTAVVVNLRNLAARIVKDMEIEAAIYNKGSDTVLHGLSLRDAEMAPLSKGAFVIDWKDQAFKPGTYRMRMTATYDGRIWEWDEEFTISDEADSLNQEAVGIKQDYTWLYVTLSLLALILVGVLAYLLGRRKKDRTDESSQA